jgi:hypothetical protein
LARSRRDVPGANHWFFLAFDGFQLLPFALLREFKYMGRCCLDLHRQYQSVPEEDMIVGLGPGVVFEEVVLQFLPNAEGNLDETSVVAVGKAMNCPFDEGVNSAKEQLVIDRNIIRRLRV